MKLLMPSVAIAITFQVCTFVPQAIGQDDKAQAQRLHLMRPIPQSGGGRIELTASEIQRDLSNKANESIIQLKGNVEIKMITCVPTGRHDGKVCEGAMVMHADAVDYNEKTGEIDASGNVHITPHRFATAPQ
jgi:lipopolysaccharide assembly outer membrane protein LptD (OstA)